MDTKDYIRRYESLKVKKVTELKEQLELEKEWIMLNKDMIYFSKKLTKKRKDELKTFIKNSFEEAKKTSHVILDGVLKKKTISFRQLILKHEFLYLKSGIKAVIEKEFQLSFDDLVESSKKKNQLKTLSFKEWKTSVFHLSEKNYNNLTEAFQVEEKLCFLFSWYFEKSKKERNKINTNTGAFNQLNDTLEEVSAFILKHLGYSVSLRSFLKGKTDWNYLREKGTLSLLELMENRDGCTSPLVKELMEQSFSLSHPRDEFPETRKIKRKFVIHVGPTNSGKTYHAINALKQAKKGVYLAPIRLLALEIQEKLNASGIPCDLVTGETHVRVPHSKHVSSVIEIADFHQFFDIAVIDEFQMIEDEFRGFAWVQTIFGLKAKEIHLCGAPHALDFIVKLINECGDEYEIKQYERKTTLTVEEEEFLFPYSVQKGDALVAFSKKDVLDIADELKKAGIKASVIYGKLPADTRRKQVELFASGETEVVVSTDAIGIGLNLPIKRVVFMQTTKFDGIEERPLTIQEVKQIAGRAGRKGMYDAGYVNAISDKNFIKEQLLKQETPVKNSVITPPKNVIELPIGTLRQRLTAWELSPTPAEYFIKANVKGQIQLLKEVEKWEHELDVQHLYKALLVPFDQRDRELLLLWVSYVRELNEGKNTLKKPTFSGNSLHNLEKYYQQLNIYYNFSRKFNMQYSFTWLNSEKKKISDSINRSIGQSRRYAVSI